MHLQTVSSRFLVILKTGVFDISCIGTVAYAHTFNPSPSMVLISFIYIFTPL